MLVLLTDNSVADLRGTKSAIANPPAKLFPIFLSRTVKKKGVTLPPPIDFVNRFSSITNTFSDKPPSTHWFPGSAINERTSRDAKKLLNPKFVHQQGIYRLFSIIFLWQLTFQMNSKFRALTWNFAHIQAPTGLAYRQSLRLFGLNIFEMRAC